MITSLIWLHEESLRTTHPVFNAAPVGTKAIFIWDDAYFKSTNYSLKRLVFIYETLCDLPVDIIYGDSLQVIKEFSPTNLYIPKTNNPLLEEIIASFKDITSINIVEDEQFAMIKNPIKFRRFFNTGARQKKQPF